MCDVWLALRATLYASGFGLLFGWAALALAAAVAVHLFVVLVEERQLERRFGDSYRQYKRSVRRWWPRRP